MSLGAVLPRTFFGFFHRGARCLLSSDEVKAIHGEDAENRAEALWTGSDGNAASRFLELRGESQWLEVKSLETIDAGEVQMLKMSEVLSGVLASRRVIGVARVRGQLHWLVGIGEAHG